MVYIYKNKRGNKTYYYLKKSLREVNEVKSVNLCYLGTDLTKINLRKLETKFPEVKNSRKNLKKFINWNSHMEKLCKKNIKENKFFGKEQLIELNLINNSFKKIKFRNKKDTKKKLNINFIAENASIEYYERKPLKYKEVKRLIFEGIYPKNKLLSKIYEVTNTNKILNFLEKEKPKINTDLIEKIHNLLHEYSGLKGYRNHSIKIKGDAFKPSSAKNIKQDLKKLLSWYNMQKGKISPLALVILFHHKFEKIHPFFRGNGETGRILMNYMLEQQGYPPIIIPFKKRNEYFNTMNKAYPCLKKDLLSTDVRYYKPLIDFMQKQFVKTYWDNFIP